MMAKSRESLSTANGASSMPRYSIRRCTPSPAWKLRNSALAEPRSATAARGQPRSGAMSAAAPMRTRPGWLIIVVIVVRALEQQRERPRREDQPRAGKEAVQGVPREQRLDGEVRVRRDEQLGEHARGEHDEEGPPDHLRLLASASGRSAKKNMSTVSA